MLYLYLEVAVRGLSHVHRRVVSPDCHLPDPVGRLRPPP